MEANFIQQFAKIGEQLYMRRRNRPVRSKSRWRKTLEKRNPNVEIVHADPRSPFMTVNFFPQTEEQRLEFEQRSLLALVTLGVALPMTAHFLTGR